MKVSILTYHWEDNYGATMQAYATYRAVKESGHTPEFIDLRLPYAPSLKSRLVFGLKRYRFNNFRKKHFKNLTDKTYRSVEELRRNPPASDCYLVGSDQTWNPQIGKKLLPAFFLTFGDDSVRRVTYATSNRSERLGEISIYLRFGNKEISGTVLSNSSAGGFRHQDCERDIRRGGQAGGGPRATVPILSGTHREDSAFGRSHHL